uniref:Uncharacterized protein n=1 Tax=Oryza rufipogon TaxID=4529 RepID=A0A0E0NPB3_ORYRU
MAHIALGERSLFVTNRPSTKKTRDEWPMPDNSGLRGRISSADRHSASLVGTGKLGLGRRSVTV